MRAPAVPEAAAGPKAAPGSQAAAGFGVFAANRAIGRISLEVESNGGRTRRTRVYEDGPLRVRFPKTDGAALEAVTVNTAGGMTGGDRHDISIAVREGADLTMTTAAAEKVYRSLGPAADIGVRLTVAAGARLSWLPQETILFDRVRLSRTIEVDMAADASVLIAETVLFGRTAMGEAVAQGSFTDRWRVRRDGRLLFAETVKLDGAIAKALAEPAVAGGGVAVATVLAVPGDQAMAERVRAVADGFLGEVGVSAWNGLAVARLCAKDGAALRSDLLAVLRAFGAVLPRLWLN